LVYFTVILYHNSQDDESAREFIKCYVYNLVSMSKSTTRRSNGNNNQVLETKPQESRKEDVSVEQLNFEIECPRCGDIMELVSEFDQLSYYCSNCQLQMNIR
jgi:formamidopyrimidine-DNA glycosylase